MLMRMGSTHERFKNKHIAKAAPGGRAAAQNRLCYRRRFSVRIIFARVQARIAFWGIGTVG